MNEEQGNVTRTAESYDLAVAGAGIAGVLTAVRLSKDFPGRRIVILEKSPMPGGRLRTSQGPAGEWNAGLAAVSRELFDYIDHCLRAHPDGRDLSELLPYRQEVVALLSGSNLEPFLVNDLFTAASAKTLAGSTAAREWEKIEELWNRPEVEAEELAMTKAWRHPKKNAAAIVLAHYANICGIPDIWTAHPGSLQQRCQYQRSALHFGAWEAVFKALLETVADQGNLELRTSCHIVEAKLSPAGALWQITTEHGPLVAKALIVAQPPWQAMDWLDRSACPVSVLNLALKAKPTSAVILCEKIVGELPANLPDLVFIPAEDVVVFRPHDGSLCFHAIIDYELSLDAPTVVKAIKRLRRASKKLKKALPQLKCEGEYLALRAVAWAQSPACSDRRHWLRLGEVNKLQGAQLAFCGDAYGNSYRPDDNLIKSVTSACASVGGYLETLEPAPQLAVNTLHTLVAGEAGGDHGEVD